MAAMEFVARWAERRRVIVIIRPTLTLGDDVMDLDGKVLAKAASKMRRALDTQLLGLGEGHLILTAE